MGYEDPSKSTPQENKKYDQGFVTSYHRRKSAPYSKPPKNILMIGNGYGWRTILFALLNADSKVAAINACVDQSTRDDFSLTRNIALQEGLKNITLIKGRSPQDIDPICTDQLKGKLDLAFIDAEHTNEAQEKDFRKCLEYANESCVFIFHDVIHGGLQESLFKVSKEYGLLARILWKTSSGMGIAYPEPMVSSVEEVPTAFSEDDLISQSFSEISGALTRRQRLDTIKARVRHLIPAPTLNPLIKIRHRMA